MSTDGQTPASSNAARPGSSGGGTGEPRTGMRLWLKVLLAVSLAANLAVAGLAIGAFMRWHDGSHPGKRPPSVGSMIFRDLDRETRTELHRRAEGDHGSYGARRRAEGEAVIAILRGDPFDAGQLARVMEQQADNRRAFQISVQRAWIAQVEAMTADERARYAERMREMLRRHAEWHKAHRSGKP